MRWLKEPFDFLHVQLLAVWLADKFVSQQNGCEIKKPTKPVFAVLVYWPCIFGTQQRQNLLKEKQYRSVYQNQAFVVFGVNQF